MAGKGTFVGFTECLDIDPAFAELPDASRPPRPKLVYWRTSAVADRNEMLKCPILTPTELEKASIAIESTQVVAPLYPVE